MKYLDTLNSVQEKLDRLGDLPVFSATVNRIGQISSSRKGDAMALAMAVMKDANLSARLLRLANSSYCNRGNGRISVVSRAVVLLGFEQIKSLSVTLKLIEGFKKSEDDSAIADLLMRSFMTASISREVATLCDNSDVEETYICGLLHSLGEILVAHTLSGRYKKMHQQLDQGKQSWSRIQLEELGGHFSDIGQDIAQSWGFPPSVVHSMDLMSAEDQSAAIHGNYQIASMSDQILKHIYGHAGDSDLKFSELLKQLEEITGKSAEKLTQCLNNSFKMACDMAQEYNLPSETLVPPMRDSGDENLDEFTRKISYYMHTREASDQEKSAQTTAADTAASKLEHKAEILLEHMQKIGDLVTSHSHIQPVLSQVLDAIVDCTGFDRAAFCLLDKEHKQLNARIAKGKNLEPLENYFHLKRDQRGAFVFRILEKGMTLLVTDTQEADWDKRLPTHFSEALNSSGFILAPLGVGKRPIGFIYADRLAGKGPISDEDFRRFNQFFLQTKMALAYSNQTRKPN
ncbi:MAG: HDOD domain-containing protein [Motiliproteus sp.]